MATFVTSDTHFGHARLLETCKRPFSSVEEADEEMIRRWNLVVDQRDTVYHLGDFAMAAPVVYFSRLNGRKHLIVGNHDDNRALRLGWESVGDYLRLQYQGARVILCHYPIEEWDGFYRDAIHLHGHQHNKQPITGDRRRDVGVDANDFAPVRLDFIISSIHEALP